MRLAIVNDWYDKKSAVFFNKDGFLRMLEVLRERDGWETRFFKKHDSTFVFPHDCVDLDFSPDPHDAVLDWKPDAILFFADFSRPIIKEFENCGIPLAICFTGGGFTDYQNIPDIVFVESDSYLQEFKQRGLNVRQAFGTNTELFRPMPWQPKKFKAVFPATFAGWKRHELFAKAMGSDGLACGFWQPHETGCYEVCQENGTALLHHQNAESCALIYNMGHTCVVTSSSVGGSQRTVLEAMASNIPVIVTRDSEKTSEYILKCGEDLGMNVGSACEPTPEDIRREVENWIGIKVNTRAWILENYSEYIYADKVKEGIESIL